MHTMIRLQSDSVGVVEEEETYLPSEVSVVPRSDATVKAVKINFTGCASTNLGLISCQSDSYGLFPLPFKCAVVQD